MARPEKISKAEADTRQKEANAKKNKKRDYRKWANKHLAPGSLPIKMAGYGEGTVNYCPKCDLKCTKSVLKDKWYCGVCGNVTVSMTKTDFAKFRESQNDKDTNKHDRK